MRLLARACVPLTAALLTATPPVGAKAQATRSYSFSGCASGIVESLTPGGTIGTPFCVSGVFSTALSSMSGQPALTGFLSTSVSSADSRVIGQPFFQFGGPAVSGTLTNANCPSGCARVLSFAGSSPSTFSISTDPNSVFDPSSIEIILSYRVNAYDPLFPNPNFTTVVTEDVTLGLTRIATVPEPSTYALLGTGLLALGGVAARRKRTS